MLLRFAGYNYFWESLIINAILALIYMIKKKEKKSPIHIYMVSIGVVIAGFGPLVFELLQENIFNWISLFDISSAALISSFFFFFTFIYNEIVFQTKKLPQGRFKARLMEGDFVILIFFAGVFPMLLFLVDDVFLAQSTEIITILFLCISLTILFIRVEISVISKMCEDPDMLVIIWEM